MIIAQITISCDICYEEYDAADVTAKLIRQAAREDGWKVAQPGGEDFCPACARTHGVRYPHLRRP